MSNSELLEQSLAELQNQMERHREVLRTVVQGGPKTAHAECIRADCPHRRKLCSTLLDTIRVMDETRKAFKSKQIEGLRKDLVRILQEELGSN